MAQLSRPNARISLAKFVFGRPSMALTVRLDCALQLALGRNCAEQG